MYYTYIVKCADGTYYVGIAKNIDQRLKQHNGELPGGAKYTCGRRPVTVIYTEQHQTHSLAAKREHALKKLTHKQKSAMQSAR